MEDSSLCSQCQTIPFESLFDGSTLTLTNRITVGNLAGIWAAKNCHFCKLVRHTLETHYGNDYMETRLVYGARAVFQIYRTPLDLNYNFGEPHDMVALCLELGFMGVALERREKETGDEFGLATILPKVQLIVRDHGSKYCPLFGLAVDCETIDWNLVRRWLQACDGRHGVRSFTEGSVNLPRRHQETQLLVIDVERDCIVPLPKNSRYIALSYTWGKDQRVKLKKANARMLATPLVLFPDDEWVSQENCENAKEMLKEYHASHPGEPPAKRRRKRH